MYQSEFPVLDSLGFFKPIKMTFLGTIRATGLFVGPGFAPQGNNIHLRTLTPGLSSSVTDNSHSIKF